MNTSKSRKKTRPLDYAPVTEKELRDRSVLLAEIAMEMEFEILSGITPTDDPARIGYIMAEALERWADDVRWDNAVDHVCDLLLPHIK